MKSAYFSDTWVWDMRALCKSVRLGTPGEGRVALQRTRIVVPDKSWMVSRLQARKSGLGLRCVTLFAAASRSIF